MVCVCVSQRVLSAVRVTLFVIVLLDVTIRALSSNIGAIALLTDWTAVWRKEVNVFWWPRGCLQITGSLLGPETLCGEQSVAVTSP